MLTKLKNESYWEFSLEATIALASFAQNSMLDLYGFSPYQRFYGSNPKSGEIEDIIPRFDNAIEADYLKGHLRGVAKNSEKKG